MKNYDKVMKRAWMVGVFGVVSLAACSAEEGTNFAVEVRVDELGATALEGADVVVGVSGQERARGQTDTGGRTRLDLRVDVGERLMVAVRAPGFASAFRNAVAAPGGHIVVETSLAPMTEMGCVADTCTLGSTLGLRELPTGVSGRARVFLPVQEQAQFPGSSFDADDNVLITGVFAAVELNDGTGAPIDVLQSPATMTIALPAQAWPLVVDLSPGSAFIDVPFFSFDEQLGQWVREQDGRLVDGSDTPIPENELPAIRAGTYAGSVMAQSIVDHLSFFSVSWPVTAGACLTGTLV